MKPLITIALSVLLIACGADDETEVSGWLTIDNDTGSYILETVISVPDSAWITSTQAYYNGNGVQVAYAINFRLPDDLAPVDWMRDIRDNTYYEKGTYLYEQSPTIYESENSTFNQYTMLEYHEQAKSYQLNYTPYAREQGIY